MLLIGFAFLAGVFTVFSPCILPVLPAILSVGTAGGRLRPLGAILGLVVSFSFFTLALTAIVHATGLSANVLRYAAIVLIFLFGAVMVFPRLSNWFAAWTATIGAAGEKVKGLTAGSGFWAGFLFGIALGLIWTPCAGPILAAIIVLAAANAFDITAVLMTLAYSIGAGIPLLLITYGSSRILQSSKFLARYTERIRQVFGALTILVAIALLFHWDMLLEQRLIRYMPSSLVENNPAVEKELQKLRGELPNNGKAPELKGITAWINSPPLSLSELKGKVVLIDFWTYSCINCLRTLPYLEKWDADYRGKGLVIIGVHTPEFEFEKDLDNVREAVEALGVKYPVALDDHYATWNAYHNRYWPAHYLIDQSGDIREVHYGEGAYMETENAIRALLGLAPLVGGKEQTVFRQTTPETYLGSARASSYAFSLRSGTASYDYKPPLGDDKVGLKGEWEVEDEYIEAEGEDCRLDLNFLAKKVYLVMGGESEESVEVYLDGRFYQKFIVDVDRMYDIVSASYGRHQVSLKIPEGVRAYVFTFGSE